MVWINRDIGTGLVRAWTAEEDAIAPDEGEEKVELPITGDELVRQAALSAGLPEDMMPGAIFVGENGTISGTLPEPEE